MSTPFSSEILEGIQSVVRALQHVSVSLDVEDTVDAVLDGVHSLIPFDAAGIYVLDPDTDEILVARERGYSADRGQPSSLHKAEEVVGNVRRAGRSLTEDVSVEPTYISKRRSTATEMAVPILGSGGRLLGALNIESDDRGAYDPRTLSLLAVLISGVAGAIERALLHRRELKARRLEHEIALAKDVMTGLIPRSVPTLKGLDIGARLLPWSAVGGDYYDFIPIDDQRFAIAMADVVGKGLPAALLVATLRASLRSLAQNDFSLRAVLRKANALFHEASAEGKFATLFYGEIDIESRRLTYVNAGHPPPVLVRADSESCPLDVGGPPAGLFEQARYLEGIEHLTRGDILVLYTDGIIEAADPSDELYGVERLTETIRRARKLDASELCDEVLADVDTFTGSSEPGDDRTVLVVKAL